MRLAVFTNQFPAYVCTFFVRDMLALLSAGIDIDIFSIYPQDIELWKFVPREFDENVLPRNHVHHINLNQCSQLLNRGSWDELHLPLRELLSISTSAARFGPGPLAKSLYVFPKAASWALEHTNDFDHILAYWGNYAGTCAYLFHCLIGRRIPFSIFLHAGTDLYRTRIYMKQKLRSAHKVITCLDFNRSFILKQYSETVPSLEDKIHVYHHGLDFSKFHYTPNDRLPRRVLAVGRLSKKKGFDQLLYATHELKLRGIDIELELIGDGDQASNLKNLAVELHIADSVIFRGWQIFEVVRTAMSKATILVHPSTGLGDGLPNVIKEAMALGTPVIATDVAGIPEAIGGNGYGLLIPPKDLDALADAIEKLLRDKALRGRLALTARQQAENKFDLSRNGQALADALDSNP